MSELAENQLEAGEDPKGGNQPDPLIGKVVDGRFRIIGVIARGGMGKVYRAEQAPLGRICALKVLSPKYEGDRDPEFHKRFFLEASIAAKLTHPNTVTVFDYGQSDEIYYIAMEFVDGKTLHRVLRQEGPFSEARTCHIARQICRSLREAHGIGVVHRDLKPGNVLLAQHGDEGDNVKVLDFGLVKDVTGEAEELTQQGLFMGSPKYMAPEQIVGAEVSSRTDIYSLGVMLYEMLCGKVPFDKGPGVGTLMSHVNDPPPPMEQYNPNLAITEEMAMTVYKCLEKDPQNRFATMDELLGALKRCGGGLDELAMTGTYTSGAYPSRRPSAGDGADSQLLHRRPSGIPSPNDSGPSPSLSMSGSRPAALGFSGPNTITDPLAGSQAIAVAPPPGDKKRFVAIVGVLVLGFAGVIFTLNQSRTPAGENPTPNNTQLPTPQTSAAPVNPTPSQAATKPTDKVVHIETDPPGATVSVKDGKDLCDNTPCDIPFRGDDAAADKIHKLTVSKKGYKSKDIKVSPIDDKVKVTLEAITRVTPGAGGTSKTTTPGWAPDPYK
jgi:eukaryotic-like serine/threonine-protein kinase